MSPINKVNRNRESQGKVLFHQPKRVSTTGVMRKLGFLHLCQGSCIEGNGEANSTSLGQLSNHESDGGPRGPAVELRRLRYFSCPPSDSQADQVFSNHICQSAASVPRPKTSILPSLSETAPGLLVRTPSSGS
jgi:hypothetical protein